MWRPYVRLGQALLIVFTLTRIVVLGRNVTRFETISERVDKSRKLAPEREIPPLPITPGSYIIVREGNVWITGTIIKEKKKDTRYNIYEIASTPHPTNTNTDWVSEDSVVVIARARHDWSENNIIWFNDFTTLWHQGASFDL